MTSRLTVLIVSLSTVALTAQGGAPKGDREMSLAELHQAAAAAGQAGEPPYRYVVEIHKKYAIPAACLVFAILGVPLGIRTHRGGPRGELVALTAQCGAPRSQLTPRFVRARFQRASGRIGVLSDA